MYPLFDSAPQIFPSEVLIFPVGPAAFLFEHLRAVRGPWRGSSTGVSSDVGTFFLTNWFQRKVRVNHRLGCVRLLSSALVPERSLRTRALSPLFLCRICLGL